MTHSMNKWRIWGLLVAVSLYTSGCQTTEEVPRLSFTKIQNYNLELRLPVSRQTFKAGMENEITFVLLNAGTEPLVLHEWQVKESKNLRIYYRPYDEKVTFFNPLDPEWKVLAPKLSANDRYNPLLISPVNMVLVGAALPVMSKPGKYLVVGELTASSVDVRSDIETIEFK